MLKIILHTKQLCFVVFKSAAVMRRGVTGKMEEAHCAAENFKIRA